MMRPVRRALSEQSGFGLVEAMVAALLLAVGALALFGTFESSTKAATAVNRQEVAANQAEKQLEWLRTLAYKDLWMSSTPNAGTGSGNPFSRISGSGGNTRYAVGGDSSKLEELVDVTTTNSSQRSGSGVAVGPTTFTVGAGTAQQMTGKIYTFISWRDEECPVVNLGDLNSQLSSSLTTLGNLLPTTTALNGLLSQLDAIHNTLLGKLSLIGPADNLRSNLSALITRVQNTATKLNGLTSLIQSGGVLDLCDLGDLGSLNAIQDIKNLANNPSNGIAQLVPNTTATRTAADAVASLLGGLGGLLSSLVCPPPPLLAILLNPTCNALNSLNNNATTFLNNLGGGSGATNTLTDLQSDLDTVMGLFSSQNNSRNTKRVTVAVTVDSSRTDVAPLKPIWLSTVIVDPSEGLL